MTNASQIPDDIKDYAGALGALEGKTGDEYLERYYRDIRINIAMRGGVTAVREEASKMTPPTPEPVAEKPTVAEETAQ